MKSWTKPTDELVNKALTSIKKITARKYFFWCLENPLWLKPLAERDCFKYPPKSLRFDDGTIRFPYWPEIRYLKNVCTDLPNEVIDLLINLPDTDNPVVYDGILDIALQIPGEYSVKLKDKILEYAGMEHQFRTYRYARLLERWTKENQTSAALALLKILVTFLTKEERTRIFETILAGPSKENYQAWLMKWLGQEYTEETEEGFLKYKRLRHRIQLAPFAPVLFGKYKTHLQKLETEVTHRIFDKDYIPSKAEVRSVAVSKRSPYSHQELAKLPDDDLLNFINAWDDEDKFYENEDCVEINIEALANAFQTAFKESIIPDPVRLKFWMANRDQIERPIYESIFQSHRCMQSRRLRGRKLGNLFKRVMSNASKTYRKGN